MSGSNLLVIVTGSIAAYKSCEVVSQWVQRGHRVRVVASESALKFVGGTTWEGLTGEKVLSDLFEPGAALEHIQLTRWANAVLVCPATANTLNRFAAGLADDLAGAIFLARDPAKPFLVAPAMNPAMWAHPATVAALARLQDWGVRVIAVESGRTACGETGAGRLAEPDAVVAAVTAAMTPGGRKLRVLVTSGATCEPIDGVRFITNLSTGETGAAIAAALHRHGHSVVLLRGRGATRAEGVASHEFGSTEHLGDLLGHWLGREPFDAVVHAAAVGDFSVAAVEVDGVRRAAMGEKLASGGQVALHLKPTPKLVDALREQSVNPAIRVVAFKLTVGADDASRTEAVRELARRSRADWVVHNDLAERQPGGPFPARFYGPDGALVAQCADRAAIAPALERLLVSALPHPTSHAPLS